MIRSKPRSASTILFAVALPLVFAGTALSGCTGAGATTARDDSRIFPPRGSTRFTPGVGCGPRQTLVGNRCVTLNNDFR